MTVEDARRRSAVAPVRGGSRRLAQSAECARRRLARRAEFQGRETPRGAGAGCERRARHGASADWASGRARCRSGMPPGSPSGLPPRRYRLAQSFGAAEATADRARFRLRSVSLRALSCRPSRARARCSSLRRTRTCGFVALGERGAHAGARLGSIRRPPIWAPRSSQRPRARWPSATGRRYREWVGDELLTGNFPAIHAVGRASAQAPRLVEIRWTPPGARETAGLPRLALIGKGVCFD